MARVLTIILNYRTPEMTLAAVEAALREMADIEGEVLVVDNDSADGSFEALQAGVAERGWPVRVLQSGRNGGFGAGNNFGMRAGLSDGSRPDYFYILNSDAFPDAGAIGALLRHLEATPEAGFAGSYIHGPERDAHVTAFRFPSIKSEFEGAARFGPVTRMLSDHVVPLPVPQATQAVEWLAGASLMMRAEVLEDIGLFDEAFFLYYEETDLCRRAMLAGWETHYVRESEVTHIGSVSTGMKDWARVPDYWFNSRWYYFCKNHGRGYAVAATLAHVAGG
ncbi:glycosyltransferase family 2 protein [Phycobium rhodophyticola]